MGHRNVRTVTVEGTTELLPSEVDAPTTDAWMRALNHASARARALAVALDDELGQVVAVVERPASGSHLELRLAVTYSVGAGDIARETSAEETADVIDFVVDTVRPTYAAFRERLLALDPVLRSSPAPLRNGKRRYEGFNRGGRNIIYAGFRRNSVRLQFELPEGHGVPAEEIARHGTREFRIVDLTTPTQVGGVIELARETLESIAR